MFIISAKLLGLQGKKKERDSSLLLWHGCYFTVRFNKVQRMETEFNLGNQILALHEGTNLDVPYYFLYLHLHLTLISFT